MLWLGSSCWLASGWLVAGEQSTRPPAACRAIQAGWEEDRRRGEGGQVSEPGWLVEACITTFRGLPSCTQPQHSPTFNRGALIRHAIRRHDLQGTVRRATTLKACMLT